MENKHFEKKNNLEKVELVISVYTVLYCLRKWHQVARTLTLKWTEGIQAKTDALATVKLWC